AGRDGCPSGWYPVEPYGFVCVGATATLDGKDPLVRATVEHHSEHLRKLPYIYGTVRRPGPIYGRLPSAAELLAAEPDLEQRMQAWLDAEGEVGASYAQEVWLGVPGAAPDARAIWTSKQSAPLPWFLEGNAAPPQFSGRAVESGPVLERMRGRVGYAFVRTVVHQGRRYGVTPELTLLPTDRLRPIRGSDFHGVEIGRDIELPFAFVRREDAKFWVYEQGRLRSEGAAEYRAAVKLTGKQQFFRGRLHFETADGKWLNDRDASRLDPARRMPAWGKNGEKWLDVNVTKQTLMLYDGTKPVFATLISTGEAGLEDPEHTTATKRGIFRIHTKHVSATMSSDEAGEEFELREVPYVQYFDQLGYALHGAYWHDRFGVPKSHGCINLSPEDARRVFYFTEPRVPVGWHGALLPLKGTVMFVHP
ncbi:MAG TPA: L,D-transpeptidase, partial [Polyangiaceae bacterium]|nr:L,D-transpeptidase [Polyangiaceae bacterium]